MSLRDGVHSISVRGTYIISAETDAALRALAESGNRPLTREIRQALEEYVDKKKP